MMRQESTGQKVLGHSLPTSLGRFSVQRHFLSFRMGTAAAVAAIYLAVMLLLTWANNAVIGRRVHYGFE